MALFGKKKDEQMTQTQTYGVQSKELFVCRKALRQYAPQMNQFTTPSGQIVNQPMPAQMPMPSIEEFEPLLPLTMDNLIEIVKALPTGSETYEKFKWILLNV